MLTVDNPSVELTVRKLNRDCDSGQTVCGTDSTKVKQRLWVDKPSVEQSIRKLNSDCDSGQPVCRTERTKVKQKILTVDNASVVRIFTQGHTFMSAKEQPSRRQLRQCLRFWLLKDCVTVRGCVYGPLNQIQVSWHAPRCVVLSRVIKGHNAMQQQLINHWRRTSMFTMTSCVLFRMPRNVKSAETQQF